MDFWLQNLCHTENIQQGTQLEQEDLLKYKIARVLGICFKVQVQKLKSQI